MTSGRWRIAQDYQLRYQLQKTGWVKTWGTLKKGYVRWAERLEKELAPFLSLTSSTRTLEVGSGPMGLVFFLRKGQRFALDPIAHDFHENFHKIQGRGAYVIQGMGEHLPFPEGSFDVVILHNTIDHTDDPILVLREARRVLKNTGVLYMGVNIYPLSLRAGSRLYEAISSVSARVPGILLPLPIFRAHPCMYSVHAIRGLLMKERFVPLKERTVGPREARQLFRRRRTGFLWRLISSIAYTGEFYQAFCKKKKPS